MSSEQTWLTVGILCDVKKPFEKITAGQIRPLSGKTEEVLCSRVMILSFTNCGKPPEPSQVEGCRSDYDGGLRLCVCLQGHCSLCHRGDGCSPSWFLLCWWSERWSVAVWTARELWEVRVCPRMFQTWTDENQEGDIDERTFKMRESRYDSRGTCVFKKSVYFCQRLEFMEQLWWGIKNM